MISISLFGAGRIGYVHALAVMSFSDIRIKGVYDAVPEAAQKIAAMCGAKVYRSENEALDEPETDAVLIASPAATHCRLILEAVKRGKAVFCEKPISPDINEARACVAEVSTKNAICSMGFNRRYDTSFRNLKNRIDQGDIGTVETVVITSRDPDLPSIDYLRTSGGLFRDMTIHDFDMARYLLNDEPVSVYAVGSCLVDTALESFGDKDTAALILRTASGKLCIINNNRRSGYGYDQRVEVLGSKGMLQAENITPTSVKMFNDHGVTADRPEYFFLERYKDAYRAEIENFVACIAGKAKPLANLHDGLQALVIAEAANRSLTSGKAVEITA